MQNFIYFPDIQSNRIHHAWFFLIFFRSGEDPVQQGDEYIFHPPLDSISQRFEGKSSASKRKCSGEQLAIFLFIWFDFLWMWIWDEELIYPTNSGIRHDSPVAALHMYTSSSHHKFTIHASLHVPKKKPQNRANPQLKLLHRNLPRKRKQIITTGRSWKTAVKKTKVDRIVLVLQSTMY